MYSIQRIQQKQFTVSQLFPRCEGIVVGPTNDVSYSPPLSHI